MRVGDTYSDETGTAAIRALFELGLFKDVRIDVSGDVLVVYCPTRSVPEEYRRGLVEFVEGGGKLLVLDSPDVVGSTVNSLLWPFGLESNHATAAEGDLVVKDQWPGQRLQAVCEIRGGEPIAWVGRTPVAARTRYGKGSVMALGFGSVFNDTGMGGHWMLQPNAATRTRFDLYFALLRALVEDKPIEAGPKREAAPQPKAGP